MELNAAARTDIGVMSENNEDWFLMAKDLGLYLLADGVGGLEAGEMASHLACRLIERFVREGMHGVHPQRYPKLLLDAIAEANKTIYRFGRRKVGAGIGTTLTTLWFDSDRVLFAAVGDSRIYLYRQGRLRCLTVDQAMGAHKLTASVGQPTTPEIQLGMVRVRSGDRFLLCSDGLHGPVPDHDISTSLDSFPDPAECCQRLIRKANDAGGPDNITVLVTDVVQPGERQPWRSKGVGPDVTSPLAKVLSRPVLIAIGAVLVVAAAVAAVIYSL